MRRSTGIPAKQMPAKKVPNMGGWGLPPPFSGNGRKNFFLIGGAPLWRIEPVWVELVNQLEEEWCAGLSPLNASLTTAHWKYLQSNEMCFASHNFTARNIFLQLRISWQIFAQKSFAHHTWLSITRLERISQNIPTLTHLARNTWTASNSIFVSSSGQFHVNT